MPGRYDPKSYEADLSGFGGLDKYRPPKPRKRNALADMLDLAGSVAPAVGAGVGGISGGIVGSAIPVLGTAAGAGIGAALGGAEGSLAGGLAHYGSDKLNEPNAQAADRDQALQDERRAREQAALQLMAGMR